MEAQFEGLASSPDILIATPGRLAHHLAEIKTFTLFAVEMLILDEADRLFEMGFAVQVSHANVLIKKGVRRALGGGASDTFPPFSEKSRKYAHTHTHIYIYIYILLPLLLSAAERNHLRHEAEQADSSVLCNFASNAGGIRTCWTSEPKGFSLLACSSRYSFFSLNRGSGKGKGKEITMQSATFFRQVVRLDTDTMLSPDLKLAFISVRSSEKTAALIHLLRTVASSPAQTLVFAPTRHHVEFLGDLLAEEGIPNARVFGKMDQAARKANISRFRSNKVPIPYLFLLFFTLS